MGYACPVCEVPQQDGEHLANHLAFTAMLRAGPHETWLDDHVDGWESADPSELATRVTPHAESADYDAVFDDTTHDHPDVSHQPGHGAPDAGRGPDLADDVYREARRLTDQMRADQETEPADHPASDQRAGDEESSETADES